MFIHPHTRERETEKERERERDKYRYNKCLLFEVSTLIEPVAPNRLACRTDTKALSTLTIDLQREGKERERESKN